MTISHSQISTPRRDEWLAGASLPDNQSPASEFLIATFAISEFDSSSSKQSRRQIPNSNKTAISGSQRPHRFRPQRQHRALENLVQCGTAIMATRLSPSHDAPLESQVETGAPRVTLRNQFAHPYDSAIAAARTCYAPRLIGPEEITDKQRVTIGAATYFGGHHTVYQHAHFEFGLENISRQFVWSFLHAHPSITPNSRASVTSASTAHKPTFRLLPPLRIQNSAQLSAKFMNAQLLAPGITTANSRNCSSRPRAKFSPISGT
jgi:hypothetical protein